MTRRRWIQIDGELVEVTRDYTPEPKGPMVIGDLPAYQSPIDGRCIDGRVQRREDLARNNCRPYEGRAAEQAEVNRQRAYNEARADQRWEAAIHHTLNNLPESTRRALKRG